MNQAKYRDDDFITMIELENQIERMMNDDPRFLDEYMKTCQGLVTKLEQEITTIPRYSATASMIKHSLYQLIETLNEAVDRLETPWAGIHAKLGVELTILGSDLYLLHQSVS
jgi:hypothetical protein